MGGGWYTTVISGHNQDSMASEQRGVEEIVDGELGIRESPGSLYALRLLLEVPDPYLSWILCGIR